MSVWKGGIAVVLLPVFSACSSTPATTTMEVDIVRDTFPEAQEAVRESLLALDDIRDRDGLLSVHVQGSKFSQMDIERGRTGFDEMLAEETAFVTAVRDGSIEWRDLKIDVFGDVAVVTSLPRFTLTFENGATAQLDLVSTLVWVRTADGWKIAHENNNAIPDIVGDPFPEALAAIKATRAACTEAALNRDWDALRSFHLESSKFTKFGREEGRLGFEEMIAGEIAMGSAMLDAIPDISVDFRDQKIDVFDDTAVETAFLVVMGTLPDGAELELELRSTSVWVRTTEGWKIAHEHNSQAQAE